MSSMLPLLAGSSNSSGDEPLAHSTRVIAIAPSRDRESSGEWCKSASLRQGAGVLSAVLELEPRRVGRKLYA
jgi:hypothetical protein